MIRLYTPAVLIVIIGLLHTSVTAQKLASTASLITGHIPHDKLTGMKARTQTLVHLVHNYLTSENGETPSPLWHGEYLAGRSSSGSLLRFGAQCSFYSPDNKVDKKAELLLVANDLSPLLGHFTVNGNEYGTIRASMSHRNGCLYFEQPRPRAAETSGVPVTETRDQADGPATAFWLIPADSSRLPFVPLTRREFLLELRKQLINDTNHIAAEWREKVTVRPVAEQEAEKQGQLLHLKALYSGADLEARTSIYLRNFITDEAYLQKHIHLAMALQLNALHFIDTLLLADPAELSRPAFISTETTEADPALSFRGFADNLPGALLLVRHNPTAFDPRLPEDKPQFLLLGWRFDPSAPFAASLDQQLHDNLDSRELQDWVGK